jgi:hypothetical protein
MELHGVNQHLCVLISVLSSLRLLALAAIMIESIVFGVLIECGLPFKPIKSL